MSENILEMINQYAKALESAEKYGKKISWLIRNAVRDIIPDLEGQIGTPGLDGKILFFKSKEFKMRLGTDVEEEEYEWQGWLAFWRLLNDVFPEFCGLIHDNGIFLNEGEQVEIKKRLEKLKASKGGKNER